MRSLSKTLVGLTIFSIAMGYLESAVVIYLRMIYYPGGFRFPLAPIPSHVALIEFFRELATLLMLAGVAWLGGRTRPQRFAYFLFCFGVWDIFYYAFLKLLLGWPASFFTWDILFLIPVPWIGPVIAPCIVSLTMIVYAIILSWGLPYSDKPVHPLNHFLPTFGSFVLVISFLWDYIRYMAGHRTAGLVWGPGKHQALFNDLVSYVPAAFDWMVFWMGEALVIWAIFRIIRNKSR